MAVVLSRARTHGDTVQHWMCHFSATSKHIFSSREHAPKIPSLTRLAHAVEHHIKVIICDLKTSHQINAEKSSVHDYDLRYSPQWPDHSKYLWSSLIQFLC